MSQTITIDAGEGWEVLMFTEAEPGDQYLYNGWKDCIFGRNYTIIRRRVSNPKQYRPFANAKEFEPHRARWVISKNMPSHRLLAHEYNDFGVNGVSWRLAFDNWTFDDGNPFGVEVTA